MSGTLMLNGTNYTATGNLMLGGGGSDANINIASEYDSTATYNYGAYCIYDGVLYRCITAISVAEAWNSTHWTAVMVTGEFRRVVELTSAQYTALSSAEKNNGTLYIITDEETTAADIPYSSGVSVADVLDSLSTVETVSITKTIVSRGSVECFKIGRIVQVCININTDSVTSPAGTEIARGLPIPISYSGLYPRLFGGQKIQNVVIDNNGYLKTVDTSMDGATWWAAQIMYFAQ